MVEQSEVTELSVQEGDLKIKISKNSPQSSKVQFQQVPVEKPVFSQPVALNTEVKTQAPSEAKPKYHEIRSPIVGTFYQAPSPDADPFVQVGDSISQGTVLCIIEAMKLMNEIESDVNGRLVKILVENGMPVEYNQPLFLVEPI